MRGPGRLDTGLRPRPRLVWGLLGALVLVQICYPLTDGRARAGLTVATVLLGYVLSVSHALLSRGRRAATALVAAATLGGFAVEAIGIATGFPFGGYHYSGELGPKLLGVPLIIPLAWTWMAWPAWLAAIRLTPRPAARIAIAAAGLAAWDVFLDPQMVAEGYWRWDTPTPALPGVPGVPIGNYLGWLAFATILMTALVATAGAAFPKDESRDPALPKDESRDPAFPDDASRGVAFPKDESGGVDSPQDSDKAILALWLWTYASSVLAHAVFLGLPASAAWGAALMGATVLPLAFVLVRSARQPR